MNFKTLNTSSVLFVLLPPHVKERFRIAYSRPSSLNQKDVFENRAWVSDVFDCLASKLHMKRSQVIQMFITGNIKAGLQAFNRLHNRGDSVSSFSEAEFFGLVKRNLEFAATLRHPEDRIETPREEDDGGAAKKEG